MDQMDQMGLATALQPGPALGGDPWRSTHHAPPANGADHRSFRGATIFPPANLFISARPFRNIGQRGLLGGFQNPPDERGGGEERGTSGTTVV